MSVGKKRLEYVVGTVGQLVACSLDVIHHRMQMVSEKHVASVVTGGGEVKEFHGSRPCLRHYEIVIPS